jgi:hypothetical protein
MFRIFAGFAFLVVTNLVLVLSSVLICTFVGPAAAGSGIPEVKAYLNGIDAPDILSPRTLLVKVSIRKKPQPLSGVSLEHPPFISVSTGIYPLYRLIFMWVLPIKP